MRIAAILMMIVTLTTSALSAEYVLAYTGAMPTGVSIRVDVWCIDFAARRNRHLEADDIRDFKALGLAEPSVFPCLISRETGASVPWQGSFAATTNALWAQYQAAKSDDRKAAEADYMALMREMASLAGESTNAVTAESPRKAYKDRKDKIPAGQAKRLAEIRTELVEIAAEIERLARKEKDRAADKWIEHVGR